MGILDLAATFGPLLAVVVILMVLAVPCVVVYLTLRRLQKPRKIDISLMGKFLTVKVEDSNAEPPALPPGASSGSV